MNFIGSKTKGEPLIHTGFFFVFFNSYKTSILFLSDKALAFYLDFSPY